MSQKVQIYKLKNEKSKSHGKYFVRAVYDKKFITTGHGLSVNQIGVSRRSFRCLRYIYPT